MFIGAALLLVPVVGWLLNMGHRVHMIHDVQMGVSPWPAWRQYGRLLKHGSVTFLGMMQYQLPAILVGALAWHYKLSSTRHPGRRVGDPGDQSGSARLHVALLPAIRHRRSIQSGESVAARCAGWPRILARLSNRSGGFGCVVSRATWVRRRLPGDQCLVLASRGVQLRHRVLAKVRPPPAEATTVIFSLV